MIRIAVLILILVFVCAVYVLHAKMEEDEEKSGDDMIKNNVIDEIAKGKDRG